MKTKDHDRRIRQLEEELGATGKFPEGKLSSSDEGEINIAIAQDLLGNVHINFGKPVMWFALPPGRAIEFATMIAKKAGAKKIKITL